VTVADLVSVIASAANSKQRGTSFSPCLAEQGAVSLAASLAACLSPLFPIATGY